MILLCNVNESAQTLWLGQLLTHLFFRQTLCLYFALRPMQDNDCK